MCRSRSMAYTVNNFTIFGGTWWLSWFSKAFSTSGYHPLLSLILYSSQVARAFYDDNVTEIKSLAVGNTSDVICQRVKQRQRNKMTSPHTKPSRMLCGADDDRFVTSSGIAFLGRALKAIACYIFSPHPVLNLYSAVLHYASLLEGERYRLLVTFSGVCMSGQIAVSEGLVAEANSLSSALLSLNGPIKPSEIESISERERDAALLCTLTTTCP